MNSMYTISIFYEYNILTEKAIEIIVYAIRLGFIFDDDFIK